MGGYFERRRFFKHARALTHAARRARYTRGDVAAQADLAALLAAENALRGAVARRDRPDAEKRIAEVTASIEKVMPTHRHAGLRENAEVLAVAVAVAMGIRAYFIQPFKIPTGSMQPSLYGIHYQPQVGRTALDRYPLNLVRIAVFGALYREVQAPADIQLPDDLPVRDGVFTRDVPILAGGRPCVINRNMAARVAPGERVIQGQVVASGVRITGDHVFVDKMRWNFRRPVRGQVMVFSTREIPTLQRGEHYIKRMTGLPGERVRIEPPWLVVNDRRVEAPWTILRVASRRGGYSGYTLADGPDARFMRNPDDAIQLGADQYLALGDNTTNSRDSRYWGAVPRRNLVGPGLFVYWPFSKRWGPMH